MTSEPIAVVAVTYSPGEVLGEFLDSVALATSRPLDIVLADNGSTDGSVEAAARRPDVRVVSTGGNLGYGQAANIGVRTTTSPFVVVANPDVVWGAGALDELLAATERWPRGASFGPLIRTPEGAIYPSAREFPSIGRGIGHALCGWWWPSNPWTASYRAENTAPAERLAGWLSGSCVLLRRAAFDAVGGFDPGYFMYFEDLDLGHRLMIAGWQSIYVPSATVAHLGRHATSRDAARMADEHHKSAWRYLSRRYPGLRWLPLRAVIRMGLALRAILAKRVTRVAEGAAPQRRD